MNLSLFSKPFIEGQEIEKKRLDLKEHLYSPSDVPRHIILEEDTKDRDISFKYSINEKLNDLKTEEGEGFKIVYSDETGRIYNIEIDTEVISNIEPLRQRLNSLVNRNKRIRIQDNFRLGIKVLSQAKKIIMG